MCSRPVGLGAKRTRMEAKPRLLAMLLGAHVPTAGGPANALANGEDRACEVIQIFNQSPRMWKGRLYKEEELDAYRAKLADSPVQDLVIHAIYLINCASEDP